MELLVTSDWHGDWMTAGMSREQDVDNAARMVAHEAIAANVDAFLFLGDLSDPDSSRTYRAQAIATRVASQLRINKIPSFWLVGNHDVVDDGLGTNTMMPIHAHGSELIDFPCEILMNDGEYLFIALPYTSKSRSYDPEHVLEVAAMSWDGKDPTKVIIAGHLNIEGIEPGSETNDMPRGRDVMFPLGHANDLFPGALLLNGHYHHQQCFKGIHIPGSLVRLTRSEKDNQPGYLRITI